MLNNINCQNRMNMSFAHDKFGVPKLAKYVDYEPQYGIDYRSGDIGFVMRRKGRTLINFGINFFTRKQNKSGVQVGHTFIVKDKFTCIEAKIKKGVYEQNLSYYLANGNYDVVFKTPKDINYDIADKIVKKAQSEVGKKYAKNLFVIGILRNNCLGRFIDKVTDYKFFDNLSSLFHSNKRRFICSELVAHTLQNIKEWPYNQFDILRRKASGLTPQELADSKIFEEVTKIFKAENLKQNKYEYV